MNELQQLLLLVPTKSTIQLFYDIETFQYNESNGYNKPMLFKNMEYVVCVGFWEVNEFKYVMYRNFKEFLNDLLYTREKHNKSNDIKVILNAHNGNGYDHHKLRKSLIRDFKFEVKNEYIKNALTNENTVKKKDLKRSKLKNKGVILERRIKSKSNLQMTFLYKRMEIVTEDNYLKTNTSIDTLGKKLRDLNILKDEDLKQDYDYTRFNVDYDLTDNEAFQHANNIYDSLDDDDFLYIMNDVKILVFSAIYYDKIFPNFDYSKMTLTANILDIYNTNPLSSFQLLNLVPKSRKRIDYTDYQFSNINYYDYLKRSYKGGLTFYNDRYINKMINKNIVALDINSSYPYAMHNFNIPTYLKSYKEFDKETKIKLNHDEDFYIYEVDRQHFDMNILKYVSSNVLRKMFVKYYNSTHDHYYINSNTLKILEILTKEKHTHINVLSYVRYECVKFGSRDILDKNYKIKVVGSNKYEVEYNNPYDINILDTKNQTKFSQEEISIAKLVLNGIYGIPALRSHFNLFRLNELNKYENNLNGFKNSSRNILFSVFVTSQSFVNLLLPLKYLTQNEIDEHFLYCDTDSLYLTDTAFKKIPEDFFDNYQLGKWSIDDDKITHFKMLHHKKYAYQSNGTIKIKSSGINKDNFNTDMTFEQFCESQFYDGAKINNTSSVLTQYGTIAIYERETDIKTGGRYSLFASDKNIREYTDKIIEDVKQYYMNNDEEEEFIYIESDFVTLDISQIFNDPESTDKCVSLKYLKQSHDYIKLQFV